VLLWVVVWPGWRVTVLGAVLAAVKVAAGGRVDLNLNPKLTVTPRLDQRLVGQWIRTDGMKSITALDHLK